MVADTKRCQKPSRKGNEWPGQAGGCAKCVRVHWYTMSTQSERQKATGAKAEAWCLLIHADASPSLSLSLKGPHLGDLQHVGL